MPTRLWKQILARIAARRHRDRRRPEHPTRQPRIEPLEPRELLAVEVLTQPPPLQLDEDFAPASIDLSSWFRGDAGAELSMSAVSSRPDLVQAEVHGEVLRLTPLVNQNGDVEVAVSATDDTGAEATAVMTLTVAPVADAPQAAAWELAERTVRIGEGRAGAIDIGSLFSDADGDSLQYQAATLSHSPLGNPVAAAEVIGETLQITTAEDLYGYSQIAVQARDQAGGVAAVTFWVVVDPLADAPRGQLPDRQHIGQLDASGHWLGHGETPTSIDLHRYYSDPDSDSPLQLTLESVSNSTPFALEPRLDEHGILHYLVSSQPALNASAEITIGVVGASGQEHRDTATIAVANPDAPLREVVYHAGTPNACEVDDAGASEPVAEEDPAEGESSGAAMGPEDPAMSGEGPAMSGEEPAIDSEEPAIDSEEPAIDSEEPATGDGNPTDEPSGYEPTDPGATEDPEAPNEQDAVSPPPDNQTDNPADDERGGSPSDPDSPADAGDTADPNPNGDPDPAPDSPPEDAAPPDAPSCIYVEPERISWATSFRWSGYEAAPMGVVALNDNFGRGLSQPQSISLRRAVESVEGWIADDDSLDPQLSSAIDLLQRVPIEDRSSDPEAAAALSPGEQDLRVASFTVETSSNRRIPRDFSGKVSFDFPNSVRLWRSHFGRWIPVESGTEYAVDWTMGVRWEQMPDQGDDRTHFQAVSNGAGAGRMAVQVEGLAEDVGRIEARFQAAAEPWRGDDAQYEAAVELPVYVAAFDADADTDNDGSLSRSIDEDLVEDTLRGPGLRISTNARDLDMDGVPDHLDGVNLDGMPSDDDLAAGGFDPLVISVPEFMPLEDVLLRLDYPEASFGANPKGLRLWTRDQSLPRSVRSAADAWADGEPGDLITTDADVYGRRPAYTYQQLTGREPSPDSPRDITLFVEGVQAGRYIVDIELGLLSEPWDADDAESPIQIDGPWLRDSVHVTVEDQVRLHVTDGIAQETAESNGSFGPNVDSAQIIVTRGEQNTGVELPVFFQVVAAASAAANDYRVELGRGGDAIAPWIDATTASPSVRTGPPDSPANGQFAFDSQTGYGSVTIPAGEHRAVIDIIPVDDLSPEWDETIQVRLVPWHQYAQEHNVAPVSPGDGTPGDPSPYSIAGEGKAELILLDNDRATIVGSENHDLISTGQLPATVEVGSDLSVTLRSGEAEVIELGGLRYEDRDPDRLLLELETEIPWDDRVRPDNVSRIAARATIGGVQAEIVEFELAALREHFAKVERSSDRIRLVVPGPDNLVGRLPTGHYDTDIELTFTSAVGVRTRTVRGGVDLLNRVEPRFGETELGARWMASGVDSLRFSDGRTAPASAAAGDLESPHTSRLASRGGAAESGAMLQRGDGSAAWFAARPRDLSGPLATQFSQGPVGQGGRSPWRQPGAEGVSLGGPQGRLDTVQWTLANPASASHLFQVLVTWDPDPTRASNASYTIEGARPSGAASQSVELLVDQRQRPGEVSKLGLSWRSLGFFETIPGKSVTLTLATRTAAGAFADGSVSAGDAGVVHDWQFETPAGSSGSLQQQPAQGQDPPQLLLTGADHSVSTFSTAGLLIEQRDRNGNRVEFTYHDADGDGKRDDILRTVAQGGHITSFAYSQGKLSNVQDFAGRTHQVRIEDGQLLAIAPPSDLETRWQWTFDYEPEGGPLSDIIDPLLSRTTLSRDEATGRVISITDAEGGVWHVTPQLLDHRGAAGSLSEPRLAVSSQPLDADTGLREPRATFAIGPAAAWLYQTDGFGHLLAEARPATENRPVDLWQWRRDRDGMPREQVAPAGGGGLGELGPQRTIRHYDEQLRLIRRVGPDGAVDSWEYDALGRLVAHQDPLGARTTWTRDAQGNAAEQRTPADIDGVVRITRQRFSPTPTGIDQLPGGLVTRIDVGDGQRWRTTTKQYYEAGRAIGLLQKLTVGAGTSIQQVAGFQYDAARNLIVETDGAGRASSHFQYDVLDRLTKIATPAESPDAQWSLTQRRYDPRGNLVAVTRPNGIVEHRDYDRLGRLTGVHLTDAAGESIAASRHYGYDQAGNQVLEVLHRDGDHAFTTAGDEVIRRQFDSRNQLVAEHKDAPAYPSLDVDAPTPPPQSELGLSTEHMLDAWGQVAKRIVGDGAGLREETQYRYDAAGRLAEETDIVAGERVERSTEYDLAGRMVRESVSSADHATATSYAYDSRGRLIETDAASGVLEQTAYSVWDEPLLSIRQWPGTRLVTSRRFDELGRLSAVAHPAAIEGASPLITLQAYDSAGNITRQLTTTADATEPTYGPAGELTADQLDRTFAALNDREHAVRMDIQRHDRRGRVIERSRADEPGAATYYRYDVMGNLAAERTRFVVGDAWSEATVWTTFDLLSRPSERKTTSAAGAVSSRQTWTYDWTGNVTSTTRYDGRNAENPRTTERYHYDSYGRLFATTHPELPLPTVSYYNARGQLVHQQGQRVGVVSNRHDSHGRVIQRNDNGAVEQFEYDSMGRVTRHRAADGAVRTRRYDALGRLATDSVQRGEKVATTSYEFDQFGQLVLAESPEGGVTRRTYDAAGLLRSESRGGVTWSYDYDAFGNRIAEYDDADRTIRYDHDSRGRVTEESWWETGSEDVQVYGASFQYTSLGDLASARDWRGSGPSRQVDTTAAPHSSIRLSYDDARQLDEVWQTWGELPDQSYLIDYDFDPLGQLVGLEVATADSSLVVNGYQYDRQGRLVRQTQAGEAASDKAFHVAYLDSPGFERLRHGQRTSRFGADVIAEVETQTAARADGRVERMGHSADSSNVFSTLLEYDAAGRLLKEQRTAGGEVEQSQAYRYDENGQLIDDRDEAAGESPRHYDQDRKLINDRRSQLHYDATGNVSIQIRWVPLHHERGGEQAPLEFDRQTLLAGVYRMWVEQLPAAPAGAQLELRNDERRIGVVRRQGDLTFVEFTLDENADYEDLRLAYYDDRGTAIDNLGPGFAELQRAHVYSYEFDHRNRLTGVVQWHDRLDGRPLSRSRWDYDVLGRVIRHSHDQYGDGSWEIDRRFLSDRDTRLLELDGAGQLQRTRWTTPGGELIGVENVVWIEGQAEWQGPIWTLADHRQTVRALVHEGQTTLLQYDAWGRPLELMDAGHAQELWDSVTRRFGQFEYDSQHRLYLRQGRVLEPLSGLQLADHRVPGADGYRFDGRTPADPRNVVRDGVAYSQPLSWLRESLAVYPHYVHPFHNPPTVWGKLEGAAKSLGWTAYVVGSVGSGAAATVASASQLGGRQAIWQAVRANAWKYTVRQTGVSAAEVLLERAIVGHVDWASRMGLSLGVNMVTGVMTGRGRINALAAMLGRQTLAGGAKVSWDVAHGASFVDSVAINAASGFGGELAFGGLSSAFRRLPRMVRPARHIRYERIVSRVPGEVRHFHAFEPGPLSPRQASTFSGARYAMIDLSEDLPLYRGWDPAGAGELGGFWSLDLPGGSLGARIDLALPPEFGNRAIRWTAIRVPAGTRVFVGEVGFQHDAWVGGGSQVILTQSIPREWIVPWPLEL